MQENIKSLSTIFTILLLFCILLFSATLSFILNHEEPEKPFACGAFIDSPIVIDPSPPFDSTDVILVKGQILFNDNCSSCHSVYARKVGPALKDISKRRTKKWIRSFIRNSPKMIEQKDPYAIKIFDDNARVMMTTFPDMSDGEIDVILYYIDYQSSY